MGLELTPSLSGPYSKTIHADMDEALFLQMTCHSMTSSTLPKQEWNSSEGWLQNIKSKFSYYPCKHKSNIKIHFSTKKLNKIFSFKVLFYLEIQIHIFF